MTTAAITTERPGGRIAAIDLARGLAMLGMITQHVAIGTTKLPSEPAWWALHASAGRASVLFFVLSGVALSLVARRGSSSASTPAMLKRGLLLLIGGLYVALTFWSGSILHTYGAMFLLAPLLLRRSSKWLLVVAAAAFSVGPFLLATVPGSIGLWLDHQTGVHGWLLSTLTLVLFQTYALVVWIGFFAVGMVLGRLDLRRPKVAAMMLSVGVAFLVPWTLTVDALNRRLDRVDEAKVAACAGVEFGKNGEPIGDVSKACQQALKPTNALTVQWSSFSRLTAHSNTTAWALQSLAIAIAVIGLCLLLPTAVRRVLRPVQAIGTVSLSCYLLHMVLVQDFWQLAGGGRPGVSNWHQIGVLGAIMAIEMAFASFVVWRWKRGPFEWLLAQFTGGGNNSARPRADQRLGSDHPLPIEGQRRASVQLVSVGE